jgi:soluble lytic murein transglycosylase-like protein
MFNFEATWRSAQCLLAASAAALVGASIGLGASPARAEPAIMVLTAADETAYRQAFAAIGARDFGGAERALNRIDDDVLAGHVLARLHLARGSRPSAAEVRDWLETYRDHPFGDSMRDKARALRVRNAPAPTVHRGRPYPGAAPRAPGDGRALTPVILRFGDGDIAGARTLAGSLIGGPRTGEAQWWLGLAAFRMGDFAAAAAAFQEAAEWRFHDGWEKAAAHYWAGRARLALGDARGAKDAMARATAWPWTFYGQLAEEQLGRTSRLDFSEPSLSAEDARAFFARYPGARRAAALAQLGRLSDVENELRLLHGQLGGDQDRQFLALATLLEAPAAQLRAAEYGGPATAAGFCPTTSFAPEGGFRIDRAVVLAIVRQESRFSPVAVSRSNARGLMQLLPSTAEDMQDGAGFRRAPGQLNDPALNLRLGQQYIEWLNETFGKGGDLARLFAAYNGGPGWLSRWMESTPPTNDPLMLLESLPRYETRDYVERVLSHMALCRKRFGQTAFEMASLASGQPAIYRAQDRDLRANAAQSSAVSISGSAALIEMR